MIKNFMILNFYVKTGGGGGGGGEVLYFPSIY